MSTTVRLIRLMAPFRWWIALAVLLSFVTIGSSVGLMAMSAYLISKAAVATSVIDLTLTITWVRFFAIARAASRYTERYVTHRATFQILARLRGWFYRGIEPLAPAGLHSYPSGDLLARVVADIETLQNFYIRVVVPPLAAALVIAGTCLFLESFSLVLALALLGFLVLAGVVLPLASRWLSTQPAAQIIATRAELNARLVDAVQGMDDLIAFGQADACQARVLQLTQELNRAQERTATIRGMGNALSALLTSLAGLVVLCLAIPLVTGGRIEGVYLALLPLTAIASFEAVQPLTQAMQYLEASQAAARRLFELLDAAPQVVEHERPSPQPVDTGIEVQNLCFAYAPGEPPVLGGVSFSIPAGSKVSLVGPSGAGKTTLVNLLLRFWEYQAGHICLGGHELRDYRPEDVRGMMSVVAQDTQLFNTTIRDNLFLANPDATDDQIRLACQQAQIHDFITKLPAGYDTMIGENGLRLSGGERQRLAIARAMLKDAPILILDEATAHLDALTERKVAEALDRFMVGRTALIISHRRGRLDPADQIISLDRGAVPIQDLRCKATASCTK